MPAKIYDSIEAALRAGIVVPGYELPAAIFSTDSNAPALPELTPADEAMPGTDTKEATPRRQVYAPVTAWGNLADLRMWGESLTDAKKLRVATVNRVERGGVADSLTGADLIKAVTKQEDRKSTR